MTKVLTAGFVLCCLAGVVAPPGRAAPLFDPADPAVASQVTTNDAKLNVLHERERSGLRIDYGHASDWPHAKFAASAIGYIRDWCDYTFLAVTVANPTDQEVKFGIRIDSTASKTRGRQASTAVPSGETMRFLNIYEYEPDARTADELADEYDVPIVIGEFHFGSLDRGMFHTGLKKATDQADRAEKYAHYIEAAATAPWCVGAHWFQYKDQALTGRGDGENYNIGFVNVADAPYPELIGAARDVHKRLYPLRAGQ